MMKNDRRSGGHQGLDQKRSGSRAKSDFGGRSENGHDEPAKMKAEGMVSDKPDDEKSSHRETGRESRSDRERDRANRDRSSHRERNKEEHGQEKVEGEKKFTGRCRLFVGNITSDCTEADFRKMFEPYGEVAECYVNGPRGFGFVRLDTRANTEAAKRALDGTTRKGRILRVRFAAHSAALKVKYLPFHATNELLEKAFSQFGEVERAIVIGDDRGKPTGDGIIEFARKNGAQQALNRINNGVFLFGLTPRPIVVELMDQKDDEDGVSEKFMSKNPSTYKEREREPGFAEPGTFEFEYGQKWKDLYNLEKQREEALKREMEESFQKLEMDMEAAEQEYQTMMLRQDLMRRQEELRRLEEEMARRREMDMRRKEEEMRRREMETRSLRRKEDLFIQQEGYMRSMHGQGMGGMQSAGQPQLRQSRFDQPPAQHSQLFGQMDSQSPMQGMQQGMMRGQAMNQGAPGMERGAPMERGQQVEHGQQMERVQQDRDQQMERSQAMERGRDRPRYDDYEPKRTRRY